VFKLKKTLLQALLQWNIRFTNFLREKNFESLKSEQYIFKSKDKELILRIYVDDGILIRDIHEIFIK